MRPSTTLGVQPGQVLHYYMGVVSISDGDDLAGDALTDLVLDPGGLSADALSLSPENLGVLPSVVLLAEIRSVV